MTKLSKQERNYLRNPEQYSTGYQRVLKHRIDKKRNEWNNDMQFIWEHRRALKTQGKRAEFDEDEAIKKEIKMVHKQFSDAIKDNPEWQRFRIKDVFRQFERTTFKLYKQIRDFDMLFYSDDFIQRYKTLEPCKRKELEKFMSEQHERLEKCSHKVAMFFKYDDKLNGK